MGKCQWYAFSGKACQNEAEKGEALCNAHGKELMRDVAALPPAEDVAADNVRAMYGNDVQPPQRPGAVKEWA